MSEMYSPMWWTQVFAIGSNVILWGWILLALFAPGLHDIATWWVTLNLRLPRRKIRARHGRVRPDSPALDDHTGSHRLGAETEEAAA